MTNTETLIKKLRAAAKQRVKTTAVPLHVCLEQIAKENGFQNWKQVINGGSPRTLKPQASSNEVSSGAAFIGFSARVLSDVRHHHAWLLGAEIADAIYNTPQGNDFLDLTIEGHRFQGRLTMAGPCLRVRPKLGECPLGVASVAFAFQTLVRPTPAHWAVCKYENQPCIDLSNLSEAGRRRLALDFGMPILGFESQILWGHPAFFYSSAAYLALVDWVKLHPRKIKRYKGNNYLGAWPTAAMLDAGVKLDPAHLQAMKTANRLIG